MCKAALSPILGGIGTVIGIVAIATPFWTLREHPEHVITDGLFQVCSGGHCQLKTIEAAELIAVTALMAAGIFLGLVAVILNASMLLMKKCYLPRTWILGANYLVSGVTLAAAPAVYMLTVHSGAFLWSFILAWCSSGLVLLASAVTFCCSSGSQYLRGEEKWNYIATDV